MIGTMSMKQYCTHSMGKEQFQSWIYKQNTWTLLYNSDHYCFRFILLCNVLLVLVFPILNSFEFYLPPLSS